MIRLQLRQDDLYRNLTALEFPNCQALVGIEIYAGSRVGRTLDTGMVVDHDQYSRDRWDYDN